MHAPATTREANAPGKGNLRAQTRSSDRLIAPLAAKYIIHGRPGHRFIQGGQMRCPQHHIQMQRSHNQQAHASMARCTRRRARGASCAAMAVCRSLLLCNPVAMARNRSTTSMLVRASSTGSRPE